MKRASLNVLQQVRAAAGAVETLPAASPPAPATPKSDTVKPSRDGKTNITGYFFPAWKNALRLVQIQTGKNFQGLLEEALIDLFRKHNVPVPTDKQEN